jgi:hypothetical protein
MSTARADAWFRITGAGHDFAACEARNTPPRCRLSPASIRSEPMPRYYFPVTDGQRNLEDDGGVVLAGPDDARREAEAIAADLLDPDDDAGADAWSGWRILVLDDAGRLVSEVPLTD